MKVKRIVSLLICAIVFTMVGFIPTNAAEPRYVTEQIGITPYYQNGSIPVINNSYYASFWFIVTVHDTKGTLENSSFNRMTSNIPSDKIPSALELGKRKIDNYTWEHDISVVVNRPTTITERIIITVESPGIGRRAGISQIKYVNPENPNEVLKIIDLSQYDVQ